MSGPSCSARRADHLHLCRRFVRRRIRLAARRALSPRAGGTSHGFAAARPGGRFATLSVARVVGLGAVLLTLGGTAQAETRVTLKAAKAGSSYYQMAVQLAEAVKSSSAGEVAVTVEESQGSVQNVMESGVRPGNYVFTSPPALIGLAQEGQAMFEGKENPVFDSIRSLFPIPSLTMHFVASEASGVEDLAGLAGKTVLLGKGSFGATEGEKYLALFDLEDRVEIADAELSNAVAALRNGQIDAFVTAGSWPAPNVVEAAAGAGVTVLSLSEEQVEETGRTRLVIPAGTYAGQEEDIVTTSLPVVTYTTMATDDDIAYALTKAFWEGKEAMGESSPWWNGVDETMLGNLSTPLHPGAVRWYDENGILLDDALR